MPTSVEPPPPHLPSFGVTVVRYFRHLVSHINNWKDVWSVRCIVYIYFDVKCEVENIDDYGGNSSCPTKVRTPETCSVSLDNNQGFTSEG